MEQKNCGLRNVPTPPQTLVLGNSKGRELHITTMFNDSQRLPCYLLTQISMTTPSLRHLPVTEGMVM